MGHGVRGLAFPIRRSPHWVEVGQSPDAPLFVYSLPSFLTMQARAPRAGLPHEGERVAPSERRAPRVPLRPIRAVSSSTGVLRLSHTDSHCRHTARQDPQPRSIAQHRRSETRPDPLRSPPLVLAPRRSLASAKPRSRLLHGRSVLSGARRTHFPSLARLAQARTAPRRRRSKQCAAQIVTLSQQPTV